MATSQINNSPSFSMNIHTLQKIRLIFDIHRYDFLGTEGLLLAGLSAHECCIYSKVSKNVHIFAKKSAEDRKSVHASSKGEAQGRAID